MLENLGRKLILQKKLSCGNLADKNKRMDVCPKKHKNYRLQKKQVLAGFDPQYFAVSSNCVTSTGYAPDD